MCLQHTRKAIAFSHWIFFIVFFLEKKTISNNSVPFLPTLSFFYLAMLDLIRGGTPAT